MNITLITTGGTIGCRTDADGVRKLTNAAFDGFKKTVSPFTVFSENMTFDLIATLSEVVRREAKTCDGIVVTHGTDTLPFTAAALSFTLSDLDIPVVLVSASAPADDPSSNARDNLDAAVRFIACKLAGVYAAYRNDGERAQILFGSRMLEAREFDGNYYAPRNRVCATVEDTVEIIERPRPYAKPLLPKFGQVIPLFYHTGIDYLNYAGLHPDAFLVSGSHSGTVNTPRVNAFVRATDVPVFLVDKSAGVTYQSTTELEGVTVVENIGYPAAFIKLSLLTGNGFDARKAVFDPITDEFF